LPDSNQNKEGRESEGGDKGGDKGGGRRKGEEIEGKEKRKRRLKPPFISNVGPNQV
jgi:hypothetical protein